MTESKKKVMIMEQLTFLIVAVVVVGVIMIFKLDNKELKLWPSTDKYEITYEKLKGKQYKDKYENEIMGVAFKLPDGWEFIEKDVVKKEQDSNNFKDGEFQYGNLMVASGDGCAVDLYCEKIQPYDMLYETTKEFVEGISVEVVDLVEVREIPLDNKRFFGYDVETTNGKTSYKTFVFKKIDDYIMSFCVSGPNKEKVDIYLGHIYALQE